MDRHATGMAVGRVIVALGRRVKPLVPQRTRQWMDDRLFGAIFQVTRVTNDIRINRNDGLEDISGLFDLSWVGQDLEVSENMSLPTSMIESLAYEVLGEAGVGGSILIYGNMDG